MILSANYAWTMVEPLTTTELPIQSHPARAFLAATTVFISLLLLIPAFTGADDFPVSSQQMFATPRASTAEFVTARAVATEGELVDLTIREIAQTDDPLIAEASLLNATGTSTLAETCRDIAGRTGRPVAAIEIVRIRVDLDSGVSAPSPTSVEVLHRCEVS